MSCRQSLKIISFFVYVELGAEWRCIDLFWLTLRQSTNPEYTDVGVHLTLDEMKKDKWTKGIRILVICLVIIAYILFGTIFFSEIDDHWTIAPILYLWIIGGLLYSVTIMYATRVNTKKWALLTVIVSGTVWILPPLMFTMVGIPFLVVYLLMTGQIVFKKTIDK